MKKTAAQLYSGLVSGNLADIAKAMTIVESNSKSNKIIARELLDLCEQDPKQTSRIGISGMPGAGKSTFIERLGLHYIEKGSKVAVLAVDPSSTISHGSILGDKTRMDQLANSDHAFIRPSPSSGSLGGVSRKTRDLIKICEAAGFDKILIETVGVGQSETEVRSMTDLFILLILPGGGDDLQGIKKGAVELADLLLINKADGENRKLAEITKSDYKLANRILSSHSESFKSKVITFSALTGFNFEKVHDSINELIKIKIESGELDESRKNQKIDEFEKEFINQLKDNYFNIDSNKNNYKLIINKLLNNDFSVKSALEMIFKGL